MKNIHLIIVVLFALLYAVGCGRGLTSDIDGKGDSYGTYNVQRIPGKEIKQEGTIVFVRPREFKTFGTVSMRVYIEIVSERSSKNNAGLLEVSIGIRNIGGRRFYDQKAPNFVLSLKTTFYDKPRGEGKPVYETNWENIKFLRGETKQYNVICPINSGNYYQTTISEVLK